ncbi:hypothetical protein IRJ41_009106 [Triplophysa rosa]|uniref:Uncharacterized protein n=1 Tax=Triplophysa rosa TaxID=992332 RepID=A0A9W7WF58_TRIRA|nr:hypothetical protein IRJ41_009106 [Triplophysa rosa]
MLCVCAPLVAWKRISALALSPRVQARCVRPCVRADLQHLNQTEYLREQLPSLQQTHAGKCADEQKRSQRTAGIIRGCGGS